MQLLPKSVEKQYDAARCPPDLFPVTWILHKACLSVLSHPSQPSHRVGGRNRFEGCGPLTGHFALSRLPLPPSNKASNSRSRLDAGRTHERTMPTTTAHTPAPLRQAGGGRAHKRGGSGRNPAAKTKIKTATQDHHITS